MKTYFVEEAHPYDTDHLRVAQALKRDAYRTKNDFYGDSVEDYRMLIDGRPTAAHYFF